MRCYDDGYGTGSRRWHGRGERRMKEKEFFSRLCLSLFWKHFAEFAICNRKLTATITLCETVCETGDNGKEDFYHRIVASNSVTVAWTGTIIK